MFRCWIIFILVLGTLLDFSKQVSAQDKCGAANGGKKCTGDKCCGKGGTCSTLDTDCGTGCDTKYGSCGQPDYKCGAFYNKKCTGKYTGNCCNESGNCGKTNDYCGIIDCDSRYGPCGKPIETPQSMKCGPSNSGKKCTGDKCCGKDGTCGTSESHCGTGCDTKYGSCAKDYNCGPAYNKNCTGKFSGYCCANSGYCGDTENHCSGDCNRDYSSCTSTSVNSDFTKPKRFKSVRDGKCLQHGGPGINGITIQPCDGNDYQTWNYNTGDKTIKNKKDGKCLQRGNRRSISGTYGLEIYSCDPSNDRQQFKFEWKHIVNLSGGEPLCVGSDNADSFHPIPYLLGCNLIAEKKTVIDWSY